MRMINSCFFKFLRVVFILLTLGCVSESSLAQKVPSDLMENCNQWKITYPTGSEDKTLCGEANNEYFFVNATNDGIVFRAPVRSDNGTTPNSSNIRSELRERLADGSADIYWTTEGTHMVYVKQAITHLPINKPHLVATQIHGNKDDGIDDSMVMRLEGTHLFLSFNGGKLRENVTIKTNYVLGDVHEVIFEVIDGKHYCYYSEDGNLLSAYNENNASSYLVKDGANDYLMDLIYDETYFKIGNYTQSNADQEGDDTDEPENYGEVVVYDFSVEHGDVDVVGVTVSPKSLDLLEGNRQQLMVEINPNTATNTGVSYSSSNSGIVSVDSEGYLTAHASGSAVITVTTDEGMFTGTCNVNVIESAIGVNIALNKQVIGSGTHDGSHEVDNLVDGSSDTRWSVSGFPQVATLDLGGVYMFDRTELVTYKGRDYQFTVSVGNDEDGPFTQIVDRSNSTTPGDENNPIVDVFTPVEGRFVKITATGAATYDGEWLSLMELRVFSVSGLSVQNRYESERSYLWPNPASSIVHIKDYLKFEKMELYDSLGKLVLKQNIQSETIDISSLKTGIYRCRLSSQTNSISKILVKK